MWSPVPPVSGTSNVVQAHAGRRREARPSDNFLNGVKGRLANETFSSVVAEGFDRQSGSKPQTAGRRGRPVSAGPRQPPTKLQTRGTGALAAMPQRTLSGRFHHCVKQSSFHYILANEFLFHYQYKSYKIKSTEMSQCSDTNTVHFRWPTPH